MLRQLEPLSETAYRMAIRFYAKMAYPMFVREFGIRSVAIGTPADQIFYGDANAGEITITTQWISINNRSRQDFT